MHKIKHKIDIFKFRQVENRMMKNFYNFMQDILCYNKDLFIYSTYHNNLKILRHDWEMEFSFYPLLIWPVFFYFAFSINHSFSQFSLSLNFHFSCFFIFCTFFSLFCTLFALSIYDCFLNSTYNLLRLINKTYFLVLTAKTRKVAKNSFKTRELKYAVLFY